MRASKARELYNESTSEKRMNTQLLDIFAKIESAAKNQKRSVCTRCIYSKEKEYLESLGYVVENSHDQRERKSWTTVSW